MAPRADYSTGSSGDVVESRFAENSDDEGAPPDLSAPSKTPAELEAERELMTCRRMYYGGFALLPWLWFVNWYHFRHYAKLPGTDPRVAVYAHRSLVGSIVGLACFVAWVVFVQLNWQSWGEFGRSIMIVVPENEKEL
jgi:presenilin enhancer 2